MLYTVTIIECQHCCIYFLDSLSVVVVEILEFLWFYFCFWIICLKTL